MWLLEVDLNTRLLGFALYFVVVCAKYCMDDVAGEVRTHIRPTLQNEPACTVHVQ